jgi:protein-S-isoprenylcysteine O-methyltransferase Ste14
MMINVARRPPALATRLDAESFAACAIALGALTLALAAADAPYRASSAADALGAAGALLLLLSIIALGASFSVLPAAIRVRTRGPFAVIRHPVYAAYILSDAAIAISHPHWLIVSATALELAALAWRARIEERLLEEALPEYGDYRRRVRSRFVPGLY